MTSPPPLVQRTRHRAGRTQKRCYYGADGKLQTVPIGSPAPAQQPPAGGGRRGRVKAKVIENKKDDVKD